MKASIILIIAFAAIFPPLVSSQTFPQPYDKYVNDFAGYLDQASILELRGLLFSLERNTTAEAVVVTVNTTAPLVPSQYRTEMFNQWHIGKKGNDNGLLILYAVKERRIEVETGYGLEGILPDSKVGRILDEFYVPYRDRNQTAMGIVLATREFARVISGNAGEVMSGNDLNTLLLGIIMPNLPFFILVTVFILVPVALSVLPPKCGECGSRMELYKKEDNYDVYKCKNGHTMRRKRRRNYFFFAGGFGGGGGGFGGGGGGGGFGGGGSGGGGAGR